MANYIYGAVSLTGGGNGSLDALVGTDLAEGDAAIVFTSGGTYIYTLSESNGGTESSPDLIAPDQDAGNKRWVLVSSRAAESSCDYALFNGVLDANDDDVQKALSTIDDMFDTGDFTIAPGSVQLVPEVVKSIGTSLGAVTPTDHTFNILGLGKVKTVGSGADVSVSVDDLAITTKTSSYTITADDDIVVADCAGGNVELTLPQCSTKSSVTIVKKSNANTLTVNGYGTETIEGTQSINILDEYGTLRLISDGTNTWITSAQMYDLPVATNVDLGAVIVGDNLSITDGVLTPDLSAYDKDIVPDVDITRSLGSVDKAWKDVFVGPGSLYINGQKVIEEDAGTIVLSADDNQNIQLKSGGGGDIEFYPSGSGNIDMKGNVSIQAGKNLLSGDGNPISCTVGFNMNGERITNIADPVDPGDVATKSFSSNADNITSGTLPVALLPSNYLEIDENLNDLNNAAVARSNIGLGNVANVDTTNASNITSGTLPSSVLPPIAITSTQVAADQTAMLGLTTQEGDVVVRTDESKSYIHNGGSAGTMADFTELQTPVDTILSVNGETGTVVLNQDDVADGATYVRTTNDFTSTLKSKLDGIEASADVNRTPAEVKAAYEGNSNTNAFTDANKNKLAAIEASATADQTDAEIKTAYENNANTNAFTDDYQTKVHNLVPTDYLEKSDNLGSLTNVALAKTNLGIENVPNIDTTNASNITSGTIPTSVLPPLAITTTQTSADEVGMLGLTTEEGDIVVRTDLSRTYIHNGGSAGTMADFTELATPGDSVISVNNKIGVVSLSQDDVGDGSTYVRTQNDFTGTLKAKLDAVESNATADQTDAEIKTAYENNPDTNAFTNAFETKLTGIDTSLYLEKSDDLASVVSASNARDNIGLGNVANVDTTNASNITSGTLPSSVLPPIAITKTQVAATEVAMLALTTEEGDIVVRTDEDKSYIRTATNLGTMADFIELASIGQAVSSVNGDTGTIVLTQDDIGAGSTYVQTQNDFTNALVSKLNGVETGATADMTAAEILAAVKTVDGDASGLDADKLKGANSSTAATANTIVKRDGEGDITARYLQGTYVNTSHTVQSRTDDIIFYSGYDDYIRKNDLVGFKTSLGLENVANVVTATGNTGDTIVKRDTNGDFSANEITASLNGNAGTATALASARTLSLTGDATGSVSFDGSANASIAVTIDTSWTDISDKPTTFNASAQSVYDLISPMFTGNTEDGIVVTYQSTDNTIDFQLSRDPVITLDGDVTGSATMTNLNSTTITTTVSDDSHAHTFATLPTVDEDTMISDSAILLPSQQSVKAYVDSKVADVVNTAPAALDTLNELAAALGDDPDFATTVSTELGLKALKTTTLTAGSGLTGGGTLAANRTISHGDTSSQASVANAARTYIKDITLDAYGHITAIASGTETVVDTNTWRDIHDTPVDGSDSISISSNWAFDHNSSASAHGATSAATASKIMSRDASGNTSVNYLMSAYCNMSHAAASRTTDTVFYSSTDDYVRKNTATGFKTSLGLENVTNAAAVSTNTANAIVRRDASGNFSAGVITATCTVARFADLAERYTCNNEALPTGTVVSACIEGAFEVEECMDNASHNVIGVVSEAAATIMNGDLENSVVVGLTGKVPVRCIGPVEKGQVIMSAGNGCAKQIENNVEILFKIGIALESNPGEEEKLVYCAIK